MDKNLRTGTWIDITSEDGRYTVSLLKDGHRDVKAKNLESFMAVREQAIDLMAKHTLQTNSVAVPFRVVAAISDDNITAWMFARDCLIRAHLKEPDALA